MATGSLNLLIVNPTAGGQIRADLDYDTTSMLVTRVYGSNTSQSPYTVKVTDVQNGLSTTLTLASGSSPSFNVPSGWGFTVVQTADGDLVPPIEVIGA